MKRVWVTDQPGRAASPQAAVRPVSNILHSEGRYARQVEVNGVLGTERPADGRPRVMDIEII